MNQRQPLSCDGQTLTVRVPLTSRKRGGRKEIVTPEGTTWARPQAEIDNTLVKAIARAHRWRRLLDAGAYGSLTELAQAEKINASYVSRVLRVTLLAPDIIEGILEGSSAPRLALGQLLAPFPSDWVRQRRHFE